MAGDTTGAGCKPGAGPAGKPTAPSSADKSCEESSGREGPAGVCHPIMLDRMGRSSLACFTEREAPGSQPEWMPSSVQPKGLSLRAAKGTRKDPENKLAVVKICALPCPPHTPVRGRLVFTRRDSDPVGAPNPGSGRKWTWIRNG